MSRSGNWNDEDREAMSKAYSDADVALQSLIEAGIVMRDALDKAAVAIHDAQFAMLGTGFHVTEDVAPTK